MGKEKLIRFFQNTNLVTNEKAIVIADSFTWRNFSKGDFFLKENNISNEYLFLENGFMRAYACDTEGNDVTTNFYSGNEVVFEVSSFFNRIASKENIQALTRCEGWSVTYEELNRLFHALPEFREFGRHILVRGFTSLKTRMLSVITETAEERYEKLIRTSPDLFQVAPLKYIASFLGVTDTSLSRIRNPKAKAKGTKY
jgi:CRP-like cAMP-binding protein